MSAMPFRVLNTDNPAEADAIVLGMNLKAVKAEILNWWACNVKHGGDKRDCSTERQAAHYARLMGITGRSIHLWRQQ